ncbi:MAG: EamA family transporter [Micavibrio aeruginosavorus]|uniref:EamA family transporter n=1 Tax=Micavibrio aeruginosavorus TaxID=349221 RepID=A0A7T5R0Q5_9BACT|nr:MAG: EamA family transporter [Micavibrio aeruginosavorus]
MLAWSWAILTLCAALCWGLAYALLGKILHSGISSAFALAAIGICTLSTYVAVLVKSGTFYSGVQIVQQNKVVFFCLLAVAACLISGQFLVYRAISLKDAPHVAILEICYPIFTCLFTWLLFRNLELSWHIVAGGILIFVGSALVLFRTSQ